MPPTEIAHFTPKTKTGSAQWIDFYDADLIHGQSGLDECHASDLIQFKPRSRGGKILARFSVANDDYYILIVKVSSVFGSVEIYIDGRLDNIYYAGSGWEPVAKDVPVVAKLTEGDHTITLILKPYQGIPADNSLWFHSITVFET